MPRRRTLTAAFVASVRSDPPAAPPSMAPLVGYAGSRNTGDPSLRDARGVHLNPSGQARHRTGRLRPRTDRSCHRSTRIATSVATRICARRAAYGIQSRRVVVAEILPELWHTRPLASTATMGPVERGEEHGKDLEHPLFDRQDRRSEEDLGRNQKRHRKHPLVGGTDARRDDQADRRAGHRSEPVVGSGNDRSAPVDLGRSLAAERLAQQKSKFDCGPEDRDLDGEQQCQRATFATT